MAAFNITTLSILPSLQMQNQQMPSGGFAANNQQFTVVQDATKRGPGAETGSAWHAERVLDYLTERETTKDIEGSSGQDL